MGVGKIGETFWEYFKAGKGRILKCHNESQINK